MHYRNILATLLMEQTVAISNAMLEWVSEYVAIDDEPEVEVEEADVPMFWGIVL